MLDGLEAADRPAELLALRRVGRRHQQGALGDAELDRAQADKRTCIKRFENLATVAGKPIGGDRAVEDDVGVRLAVRRLDGTDLDPGRVRVEQEDADVTVVERGRDQDDPGQLRGRHQLLDAVEPPAVARADVRSLPVQSGRSDPVRPNLL